MNLPLPHAHLVSEVEPCPLAKAALRVEPRLSDLIALDELELHLQRFARQLRISAERDAVEKGDVTT